MDLDSKTYSKLIDANNTYEGSAEYIKILDAMLPLTKRYDYKIPEMWYSHIRDLFKKILEENSRILSKNEYIIMYEKIGYVFNRHNQDNHLKRCISENTISNKYARRNEILKSIDTKKFKIWQYKQYILQEEAKINCLYLKLFFQSTLHSEKDKLALSKVTVKKNTMPSAPNFEPAYISITFDNQEMVLPISHQSSNYKSDTGELFISSQYVKQPKGTILRLRDGRVLMVV
ncbi:hypothetical protein GLOIN_2v1486967 [Rhizophagus clarus]|uniref:Uncharacterized protein n=1 Tax=Rhizophagus clarus TaxID=94130 RepID=A0A8H3QSD7_9GLOM|nr:hypothetical protein GLOIN_2v1486967 [Rhizophagus clarus]